MSKTTTRHKKNGRKPKSSTLIKKVHTISIYANDETVNSFGGVLVFKHLLLSEKHKIQTLVDTGNLGK